MRKTILAAVLGTSVLGLALALPSACHAQAFWGGELERALRPGAYVPYDGMPYMQRYNYEYGPGFYLGASPQRIATLDYLDRRDRADEIGLKYQAPWNPYGKTPLFNRMLGHTYIEGPASVPYYPPPSSSSFQVQFGAEFPLFGR